MFVRYCRDKTGYNRKSNGTPLGRAINVIQFIAGLSGWISNWYYNYGWDFEWKFLRITVLHFKMKIESSKDDNKLTCQKRHTQTYRDIFVESNTSLV